MNGTNHDLPPRDEMLDAFFGRDPEYEGVFYTGVQTTGIFCRPTCPARKPRPENVDFFPSASDALYAGYRPCGRCRPMEPLGTPPTWIASLLADLEADPSRRWTDQDLRGRGLNPSRVRRWFLNRHGMTFHAYGRARRLGLALGRIKQGVGVASAAFDHGYDSLSGFNEAFLKVWGRPPTEATDASLARMTRIETPLGPMVACATDEALLLLEFADRRRLERQIRTIRDRSGCLVAPGTNRVLEALTGELARYFDGDLEEFSVPLSAPGTPFQEAVWSELRMIPYGKTVSYGELAKRIGQPTAVRAVARANGDNRIAILIPCHRVIGSDGTLTGYGGGLWRKRRLLDVEGGGGQLELGA